MMPPGVYQIDIFMFYDSNIWCLQQWDLTAKFWRAAKSFGNNL